MGCSGSALRGRRSPEPPPGPPGPPRDEYETIPDQTKLDPVEDVSLASEETKPEEHLPGGEAVLILALEEKIDSVSKREEPEGNEPLPMGSEESTGLPSAWREESTGPSPPAPGEGTGSPSPGPAENSGLVEGNDSSVVEIIKKEHITEEDQLTEGETGEQVETELLSKIVSEGSETKEEETGEAVDGAAATEIETANNEQEKLCLYEHLLLGPALLSS